MKLRGLSAVLKTLDHLELTCGPRKITLLLHRSFKTMRVNPD